MTDYGYAAYNLRPKRDQLDAIIAYEQGDLDEDETVELFQDLLDSGLVWQLQGHYGRQCVALIDAGLLITNRKPNG